MSDPIFGADWLDVVGSLVLISFLFTTVLVVAAGYMYRMLKKLQKSIDQLTLNRGSPDPLRRYQFGRPGTNAGYEHDIPRPFGGSGLHDSRQPKLGHTFDTSAPSLGRDRDDPYSIPRALSSRDNNDSRGSYPNKMSQQQESYLNQYRCN
ncbi:unnamed protein product [Callosobruchus maculatus]|uniref:Uncharacterized protein n=1 Tax=Callosobruchus maculatus TaxID=64391 RepID=A0A653C814_CALMS|nr:unnamed protein product [Callosobruchus maculatus]